RTTSMTLAPAGVLSRISSMPAVWEGHVVHVVSTGGDPPLRPGADDAGGAGSYPDPTTAREPAPGAAVHAAAWGSTRPPTTSALPASSPVVGVSPRASHAASSPIGGTSMVKGATSAAGYRPTR